jgi:hypothetical protein
VRFSTQQVAQIRGESAEVVAGFVVKNHRIAVASVAAISASEPAPECWVVAELQRYHNRRE